MVRVEIDRALLDEAREVCGLESDRGVAVLALESLIAAHRQAQRAQLIDSGAFTEEELAEAEAQIASGELDRMIAATQQRSIDDSYSTGEVGEILQRSPSRINRRAAELSLYSFRLGRSRRFPKWQFTNSGEIPGLAKIVPAIPESAHPMSVDGYMRNPSPALVVNGGTELSPVEWLVAGANVDDVVEILEQWPRR